MSPPELEALLERARRLSWRHHGRRLTIATPGMFVAYGRRGRYPAVSLTGTRCEQGCDHCRGRLLETMLPATDPQQLLETARRLEARGQRGMLISGGNDPQGRLPWSRFLPAIAEIARTTRLTLTAHVARLNPPTARALKAAGVRQALVDVVGDPETARQVLHLPDGLAAQSQTLAACQEAGLEVVPHIILGLHRGRMRGEEQALEIVSRLPVSRVVFVVFMPLKHTPLAEAPPPEPEEVARFLATARLRLPRAQHHLGCARPRGAYRQRLDALAVRAGINALAIPSDAALDTARQLGVDISYRDTCCSLVTANQPREERP